MNIAEVEAKVKEIIANVLVIEKEEVALNHRLIADLGAESIDFLDLVFQLEKEFAIKIPRGQLEKNARGNLSQEEFETAGTLTTQGMQALQQYLNEVPAQYFKANMKVSEIPALFTVETFCKLVVSALNEQKLCEEVSA